MWIQEYFWSKCFSFVSMFLGGMEMDYRATWIKLISVSLSLVESKSSCNANQAGRILTYIIRGRYCLAQPLLLFVHLWRKTHILLLRSFWHTFSDLWVKVHIFRYKRMLIAISQLLCDLLLHHMGTIGTFALVISTMTLTNISKVHRGQNLE